MTAHTNKAITKRTAMLFRLPLAAVGLILACCASCVQPASQHEAAALDLAAKDTCDNPDAHINCCFVNMPATLSSTMLIASTSEPGERIIITGTIFKNDGITPYPNMLMYAYHTDNKGFYSKKGNETGFQKWHGYLHGWCKTDAQGKYEIQSIRPGRYPVNLFPAHIHAALKPVDSKPFYISDFVFSDDSLVNAEYLSGLHDLGGGTGVVELQRGSDGVWKGVRDIVLE